MIQPERITLDKLHVAAEKWLPKSVLMNAKLEEIPDLVTNSLCYMLRSYVLGNRIAQYDVVYCEPKNWWQHLKMQIGWHYETTERVHRITRYRTYPHADIALPRLGSPVTFELMEEVPVAAAYQQ